MAYGVFLHRADSIYDDRPEERYQFPRHYLSRAEQMVDDWIIYLEPAKVARSRGYFAVARVAAVIEDPSVANMHLALIAPGSFLPFPTPVPFSGADGPVERGLLNASGQLGGNRQSAVRLLSPADFARIVNRGLGDVDHLLPRQDEPGAGSGEAPSLTGVAEPSAVYDADTERLRVPNLGERWVRDRVFRRAVLNAYGERCALTGLRLINGGGRAEAEAAHIRPVAQGGPDTVTNGLALSGTVHWLFDRGLVSLNDDLGIIVSRQVNDPDHVWAILRPERRALLPARPADRPHPAFLKWHRENLLKP